RAHGCSWVYGIFPAVNRAIELGADANPLERKGRVCGIPWNFTGSGCVPSCPWWNRCTVKVAALGSHPEVVAVVTQLIIAVDAGEIPWCYRGGIRTAQDIKNLPIPDRGRGRNRRQTRRARRAGRSQHRVRVCRHESVSRPLNASLRREVENLLVAVIGIHRGVGRCHVHQRNGKHASSSSTMRDMRSAIPRCPFSPSVMYITFLT